MESKKIIDAIKKILTDLSKLDDQQLEQVIDGSVKFKCEALKAKNAGRSKSTPAVSIPEATFEEYKTKLLSCTSRDEATKYLNGFNMKIAELKQFAQYLNVKVPASGKSAIVKAIVDRTIGFRLDSQATFRT